MISTKPPSTTLEGWLRLSNRGYYVAALIGLLAVLGFFRAQLFITTNEFISFYAGARFAGTPYLYDKARVYQEQIRIVGGYGDPFLFGRLPFYAAFLSPLGRLSYRVAYYVWQGVMFGALLGIHLGVPSNESPVDAARLLLVPSTADCLHLRPGCHSNVADRRPGP